MLKKISLLFIALVLFLFCQAQDKSFDYKLKAVDGNCSSYNNPQLQKELDKEKKKLEKKTSVVIGYCPEDMVSEMPQSPLSNFLTDILVDIANEYCQQHHKEAVDFSLLNFGGIRSSLRAGNITVGNLFEIAPFENTLVIANIKGSELLKIFRRFKVKKCEPYSQQVSIQYVGDYFHKALIHGKEIDNDKIYRVVTLDFILTGGDKILEGVEILSSESTNITVRDAYIKQIRKMTAEGKVITGKFDERMSIMPQPR
ncbi:MAG: 5'-nucleotidase C-terminal domain-containing protein [Bacteroidales bacterium]|nr:5'-nucleotidase C-terminal domain-containing protein [Bacteroidales bacterium]